MINAWCGITGNLFKTQRCDSPTAPTTSSGSAGRNGFWRSSLRAASRRCRAASALATRTTNGMRPSCVGYVSVSIGSSAPVACAAAERRAIAPQRSPRATRTGAPNGGVGSAIEGVPTRERAEGGDLLAHPRCIAPELGREERGRARRDLARGARVEQQRARAAREHVLDAARHLVARAEHDLRAGV